MAAAGTESQRLLVVTMQRLSDPGMLMAVDHKGRLLYANAGELALAGDWGGCVCAVVAAHGRFM
jgi:hypothetical protein